MGSLPSFLCRAQPGNDYACKSVMFYGAAMETRFRTPVVEVGNCRRKSQSDSHQQQRQCYLLPLLCKALSYYISWSGPGSCPGEQIMNHQETYHYLYAGVSAGLSTSEAYLWTLRKRFNKWNCQVRVLYDQSTRSFSPGWFLWLVSIH